MWKDFFYYSRSEQRGIVVLLILVFIVITLRILWPFISLDQSFTKEELDFINNIKAINDSLVANQNNRHLDSLFLFNPNEVTESEMMSLGFSSYQIKSILGYRTKVGKIKSIVDLQKVYGIDSLFLKRYSQFIQFDNEVVSESRKEKIRDSILWIDFNKIDDHFLNQNIASLIIRDSVRFVLNHNTVTKNIPFYQVDNFSDKKLLKWILKNSKSKHFSKVAVELLDLNTADTLQLKSIKGIGSVLSKRIIKYRNLLGGYVKVEQLKEVYGISEELYERCKTYFYTETSKVKRIPLLESNIKVISKHPYFNYEQSKELVNLHRKGVDIKNINASDLKNIDEIEWELMKLYLDLDDSSY